MKFTKEQAIQELKARFIARKGEPLKLSDRTIGEALDSLMAFAGEETELAEFCDKTFPVVASTNGNLIKETADGIRAYTEANPAKPVVDPQKPDGQLTLDDIRKILKEETEPIRNELGSYKRKETNQATLAKATEIFNSKNPKESLKQWKEEAILMVGNQITDTDTPETVAAKIEAGYNRYASLAGDNDPYIPINAGGGTGPKEGTPEFFAAQRAELEKEGFIKKT